MNNLIPLFLSLGFLVLGILIGITLKNHSRRSIMPTTELDQLAKKIADGIRKRTPGTMPRGWWLDHVITLALEDTLLPSANTSGYQPIGPEGPHIPPTLPSMRDLKIENNRFFPPLATTISVDSQLQIREAIHTIFHEFNGSTCPGNTTWCDARDHASHALTQIQTILDRSNPPNVNKSKTSNNRRKDQDTPR